MRRTAHYLAAASTLALLACMDAPTFPEDRVEPPAPPEEAAADAPGAVTVGGMPCN